MNGSQPDPLPPLGRKIERPAAPTPQPQPANAAGTILRGPDGKLSTNIPTPPTLFDWFKVRAP